MLEVNNIAKYAFYKTYAIQQFIIGCLNGK